VLPKSGIREPLPQTLGDGKFNVLLELIATGEVTIDDVRVRF